MARIEQPAALDRWPSPDGRLITLILVRCSSAAPSVGGKTWRGMVGGTSVVGNG